MTTCSSAHNCPWAHAHLLIKLQCCLITRHFYAVRANGMSCKFCRKQFNRGYNLRRHEKRPWFSPSFLTFRTQAFNPCPHFDFGNSCLSPHCQNLHGFSRSQQTKNGLPKFSLLTSLTTFIFASLWWVSHTGWIGPFALHIDMAVSYNERSWSGQKNSQLLRLFLLQSQNFPFFVEIVDAGNPCKHTIAVGKRQWYCLMRDIYVLSLKPVSY
jgi:hypothetical protein